MPDGADPQNTRSWEDNFEPVEIGLDDLPNAEEMNDPHGVTVRMAAMVLGKSRPELLQLVEALGACDPEGGETAELLDGLQQTETFLAGALELVREARSRVKACTNTVRLQWRMELED